ncbi:threonine/homoserine exporter RhtA [Ignatzschineria indica]|uniref:Threonine/homoserine exporter RhtA n=1 Tax=Ignatzschineria indica TaxID=472583 RepID=A0A2U2AMZ5_9GAMM|nr:threonine/homoserine exporter RhtA [Ignatzschineria indica]PWD84545.1 threonine/homoserine exporter RhtA [Ignatzschineria indica]GGZ77299.1 threonine/homoserine exporter RhtA [Ignatzschineria indica]
MIHSNRGFLLPLLCLFAAMISIQGGATLAKQLFPLVGVEAVTAYRLGFSAIILLIIFKPWKRKLQVGYRRYLLYYGITLGTMNFLFYQSIKTIPLGIAVGLEFTGPLAVALFASRRKIDFLWIGLVVLGLLALIPFQDSSSIDLLGVFYALTAGVCWALYIVFGQKAGNYYGTATVGIGAAIAAIIYVPIGVASGGFGIFAPQYLPMAIAVAVLTSALPYALEMMALTRMPAKTFGTLTSLEPAIAAIFGFIILSEVLSTVQIGGILAIIIASLGASLSSKPIETVKKVD